MRRYYYRRVLITPLAFIEYLERESIEWINKSYRFFKIQQINSNQNKTESFLFYSVSTTLKWTLNKTDRGNENPFATKNAAEDRSFHLRWPSRFSLLSLSLSELGTKKKKQSLTRPRVEPEKEQNAFSPVGEREEEQQLTRIPFRKSSRALSFHPLSS